MAGFKKTLTKVGTSLTLIVLVAFGARIGFAWNQARKMPRQAMGIVPFQQETGNIAYSLAQGQGFSSAFRTNTGPSAWLTPVYPLLIAGIFKIFGVFTPRAFLAAVFLNIVFSTAVCVPVFFAGKRIGGMMVASLAAWLWAIFPNAVIMPFEWIWDTSLSAFLAAALLWATLALAESKKIRDWCGYGLLWGLALLTNPALGSLFPFLLGWAIYRRRSEERLPISRPALAVGVAILCCLPWTIRNYAVFHKFVPLRSNFAFELWIGNNDIFDLHAKNGRRIITRYEEERTYTQMGEVAYVQDKWEKATAFIKSRPALVAQLTWKRVIATWFGTETPWKNFVETDSLFIRVLFVSNFLAVLGTLAGIARLILQRSAFVFPLATFPMIYPVIYYITHTSLRYRHPIDPVLLLLTAIAVFGAGKLTPEDQASSI
jgi:4-amino-4-deoxy-L-arabinose transferase-like glycosyltransferase